MRKQRADCLRRRFSLFSFLGFAFAATAMAKAPPVVPPKDPIADAKDLLLAAGATPIGPPYGGKPWKGTRVRIAGCQKVAPSKWAGLFLLDRPVEHEFRFNATCDLEGRVVFKRAGFPVDLRVRNLGDAQTLKADVKMDAVPAFRSGTLQANVKITDLRLLHKEKATELLAGDADYSVVLGINGELRENRGGIFKLKRHKGATAKGEVRFRWDQGYF